MNYSKVINDIIYNNDIWNEKLFKPDQSINSCKIDKIKKILKMEELIHLNRILSIIQKRNKETVIFKLLSSISGTIALSLAFISFVSNIDPENIKSWFNIARDMIMLAVIISFFYNIFLIFQLTDNYKKDCIEIAIKELLNK